MRTITEYDLPIRVTESALWRRLASKVEYAHVLIEIRKIAMALATKIANSMPEYTDHSVDHMDALWRISGQVLSDEELGKFSASEAFVLGAAFYLHDLGMASGVTVAGKEQIRTTEEYKVALARFSRLNPSDESAADALALREATRELHATNAVDLASQTIPGLDRFLIEDSDFRQRWAFTIGQIAASHHWNMDQVERSLGGAQVTPGPDGDILDLGYVASALRVIDFAHIDRGRAPSIERRLRSEIPSRSKIHWEAQENITGPVRNGDFLVYGCTQPLKHVDAWWLFYDLSVQLDSEIRGVHEYLQSRTMSTGRFSLKGVKAVESPSAFSEYVRLAEGVVPVDIRVQPDSMERVVELLGGHHIYGADELAPIRELIQNARDAIELRQALERADGRTPTPGQIVVKLEEKAGEWIFSVQDNGVGMTRSVVRKHLVGVGSDFWNSMEFYQAFRKSLDAGFRPIGKFGIGFLSVFMLGEHVEVETESKGNNRLHLSLDGVGRRGVLRESKITGAAGTSVRITLKEKPSELASNLVSVVRARAPMLSIPIHVAIKKGETTVEERIEPGWWKTAPEHALLSFVRTWSAYAFHGGLPEDRAKTDRYSRDEIFASKVDFGGKWFVKGWPGSKPAFVDDATRLLSQGGDASFGVILCSQGIAVQVAGTEDITGVIEAGPAELTASRERFATAKQQFARRRVASPEGKIVDRCVRALLPSIISRLDEIYSHGMLPGRISFIRGMAATFGTQILEATKLKWIPVTLPPGDLIHHSRQELVSVLRGQNRVLIAIGISTGGAYAMASSHVPTAEIAQMPLVSLGMEEMEVGYRLREDLDHEAHGGVLTGTLDRIISVLAEQSTRGRYQYDAISEASLDSRLLLTNFLIRCVGDAWGMTPAEIRTQQWYFHYQDNVLLSDLRRI